ncbi:hypothetical protein [Streptomyces sp. NPDC003077]|uniref:hypothetical protein n=1 Tax=Streptomyces sp. NPDC003077 TaxID=3154443 RepID=UPI0033B8CFCC
MSVQITRRAKVLRAAAVTAAVGAVVLGPVSGAFAASGHAATPAAASQKVTAAKAGKGTFVRQVKLVDGSIAKVYKVGAQHFRVECYSGKVVIGNFESTPTKPYSGGENNGTIVAFGPNGQIASWNRPLSNHAGGAHTEVLADARTTAKVTSLGGMNYKATLTNGGRVVGTIEARDKDGKHYGATKIGKMWVVLNIEGRITSHVEGGASK